MRHRNSSIIKFLIKLSPVLLISAVSVAVLHKVLFSPGLVMYSDFVFAFPAEKHLAVFYPMWSPYGSYSPATRAAALPFVAPVAAIASALHIPMEIVVKMHLLGGFILIGCSMYYASKTLLKEYGKSEKVAFIASMIAALVYMFNPWSINHIAHVWLWMVSYALAPLLLVCFMRALKTGKMGYIVASALLLCLLAANLRFALPVAALLAGWLIFTTFSRAKSITRSEVLGYVKVSSLILVFFLAFSAFWLSPFVLNALESGRLETTGQLLLDNSFIWGSHNSNLLNVIRFMGYSWVEVGYQPSSEWLFHPWLIASFALPLFAFASLLLNRPNRHSTYFLLMGVIFIFLAKGTQPPFPSSYEWLVFDIPFFSEHFGRLLRDPNVWEGALALSVCFLLSFTIAGVLQRGWRKPNLNWRKPVSIAILLIFVSSSALFVAPQVKGWFGQVWLPVEIPEEFHTVNNWVGEQNGDFKVSWLPEYGWRDTTWGSHLTGSVTAFDVWSSSKPNLADDNSNPFTWYYNNYIYSEALLKGKTAHFGKYLDPINTRYVLYHDDIIGAKEEATTAIANLNQQKDMKFIKQEGFYYIFENENYAPHIFIPSQVFLVSGGLDMTSSLNAIEAFDPGSSALLYLDQSLLEDYPIADGIILAPQNNINDIALAQVEERYLIAPSTHTYHWDPARLWSKTTTTDNTYWYGFLKMAGVANPWDFDYGKGAVVTYDYRPSLEVAAPRLIYIGNVGEWEAYTWTGNDHINISSDSESLSIDYTFDNENSVQVYTTKGFEVQNWEGYDTLSLWVYGDGSGNLLQFGYRMNYDESLGYGIGQCTLNWEGWKKLSFSLPVLPRDNVHRLMIHVVWDLNRSQQGLGSHSIMVKDMTLSSESTPPPRHTLDMPVEVREEGQYELYARVLDNPKGGELTIYMDGQKVGNVTTEAQTSAFVWKHMGTISLNTGKHSITLENTFGFNAVNVLALIPQDVAQGYFDSAYQFLEGMRSIHILEGERDLGYENGEVSNSLEASGGQTLVLNMPHRLFASPSAIDTGSATGVSIGVVTGWDGHTWTENDHINISSDGESLNIDYTFDNENSVQVYTTKEFHPENWEGYDTLSVLVYGDGSGNVLQFGYRMNYDESAGWAIGQCTLDWEGWKRLSFPLTDAPRDKVHRLLIHVVWDINKSPGGLGSHRIAVKDIELSPWDVHTWTDNDHISIDSDGDSLVLDYTFDNENSVQVYTTKGFELENWEGYDTLSVLVYGDGSGNVLQLGYRMSHDETAGYGIGDCKLDWQGWKRLSFPLPDAPRDNVHRLLIHVVWDINKSPGGLGSHTIEIKDVELSLEHPSEANGNISVLSDSHYEIAVRARMCPGCKPVVLEIDGKSVDINLAETEEGLNWVYSEPVFLQRGEHNLRILPTGRTEIDSIIVYSTTENETLSDVFTSSEGPISISWEEIDATKYVAHVDAQSPFMLAFAEAYDPLWVARVNSKEYKSLPLYSVINGFWIEETGDLDIVIEYKPQRWFYYGAAISAASFLGVLGYMTLSWGYKKRKARV